MSSSSSGGLSGESLSSSSSGEAETAINVPTSYSTEYREEAELGDTYAKEQETSLSMGIPKRKHNGYNLSEVCRSLGNWHPGSCSSFVFSWYYRCCDEIEAFTICVYELVLLLTLKGPPEPPNEPSEFFPVPDVPH